MSKGHDFCDFKKEAPRASKTDLLSLPHEAVPPLVRDSISARFGSLFSDVIEDGVKVIRDFESASGNGVVGRKTRWQLLKESHLVTSRGRQVAEASFDDVQRNRASVMSNAFFSASRRDFSLGAAELQTLKNNNWPSPSPLAFQLAPLRMRALLSCTDLQELETSWKSLLAQPGDVLFHDMRKTGLLVLKSSSVGMWCWKVVLRRAGALKYFHLLEPDEKCPTEARAFLQIATWEGWRVSSYEVLPPALQYQDGVAERPGGVIRAFRGKPVELLQCAGQRAFRGLSTQYLQKLLRETGIVYARAKDRPSTERALCETLVRWACPHLDDSGVSAAVERRLSPRVIEPCPSQLLDEEGKLAAGTKDLIDEADIEETHAALLAHRDAAAKARQVRRGGGGAGAACTGGRVGGIGAQRQWVGR